MKRVHNPIQAEWILKNDFFNIFVMIRTQIHCYIIKIHNEIGKWYFVLKIVLTYCENFFFLFIEKKIRGWRPRICKIFEITRTIHSSSERSEQFLVTECYFNFFLEVSQIWWIKAIRIQIALISIRYRKPPETS